MVQNGDEALAPTAPVVIQEAKLRIMRFLETHTMTEGRDPLRRLVARLDSLDVADVNARDRFLRQAAVLRSERIASESDPDVKAALGAIRSSFESLVPVGVDVRLQFACAAFEAGDSEIDLTHEQRATYFTRSQLYARNWSDALRKKHLRERDGNGGFNRMLYLKTRVERLESEPAIAEALARNKARNAALEAKLDQIAAEPIEVAQSLPLQFHAPKITVGPRNFLDRSPGLSAEEASIPTVAHLLAVHDTLESASVLVNGVQTRLWTYSIRAHSEYDVCRRIYRALHARCKAEVAVAHPNYRVAASLPNLRHAIYQAVLQSAKRGDSGGAVAGS